MASTDPKPTLDYATPPKDQRQSWADAARLGLWSMLLAIPIGIALAVFQSDRNIVFGIIQAVMVVIGIVFRNRSF